MQLLSTRDLFEKYEKSRTTFVEEAHDFELPFSAYVNLIYDDADVEEGDKRSGFEKLLAKYDITLTTNVARGVWSTKTENIIGNEHKETLLKEAMLNAYRSIVYAPQMRQALVKEHFRQRFERAGIYQGYGDTQPGTTLTPYFDAMAHWDQDVEVDITLDELTTRMADTSRSDYRATILEYDKDAFTEERTAEAGTFPMARFETSERPIQLKKRGLTIPFTYEHLRNVEFVDKLMEHVQEIGIVRTQMKVDEGIQIMVEGHGDTAAEKEKTRASRVDLTTLDGGATSNVFTEKAYLALQKRFKRSYTMTSILAGEEDATEIQLLKIPGTNVMGVHLHERPNAISSGFGGGITAMNQTAQGVRLGWVEETTLKVSQSATNNRKVLAYDRRKMIEYVSQMNTDIIEDTRDILKQVEYVTCSEVYGFIAYQPAKAGVLVDMGTA